MSALASGSREGSGEKGNLEERKEKEPVKRDILTDTDRNVVEDETKINHSWAKFYDILHRIVKLCIPVCKRHSREIENESGGVDK